MVKKLPVTSREAHQYPKNTESKEKNSERIDGTRKNVFASFLQRSQYGSSRLKTTSALFTKFIWEGYEINCKYFQRNGCLEQTEI